MKELLKRLLRGLCGDYEIYYVLARECGGLAATAGTDASIVPIDADAVRASPYPEIREQAFYAGDQALGYGYLHEGQLAAVCFYWYGDRYRKRNFWPLKDGEAKLVEIITAPTLRGKGIAPRLIDASLADVARRGFARAYARVWHSNTPSLRAFARSGWQRKALVIDLHPFGRKRALRLRFPAR